MNTIQYNNSQINIFIKLLVVGTILVSIDFWSYIYLPNLKWAHFAITFTCIFLLFFSTGKHITKSLDNIVKWTILTIFLSIISSVIDYNQSYVMSAIECINLTYPLFVFLVISKFKISQKYLIYTITVVCVIWVCIELIQQITYPSLWFSGRYLIYGGIEERFGLWRFYIWGVDFVMMAYAFWIASIKNNTMSMKAFGMTAVFFVGLLCYGSRKHIYVALFILILFAFSRRGTKFQRLSIILVVSAVLFFLYLEYYADLQSVNDEAVLMQGEGEDFIRLMAAKYYLFDFSDSKLYPFFGAGLDYHGSNLRNKLLYAQNIFGDMRGFWQADVGIIGYYSKFGLLGVSAIIMYIVYFIKNWKFIDDWLKYFFIMKIMLIVFDFWAIWDVGMAAYSIFLYFLEQNITENKLSRAKQKVHYYNPRS